MAMERYRPRRGAVATWRPFEEMERMMDEFFREWPAIWERRAPTERMWVPRVDIYDKEDSIVVRAELPGMRREEVDVSVIGDTLTISGERKAAEEVADEDYYRCEMTYGKFSRAVTLPSMVDAEKIDASYENGILTINMPKVEQAKPKRIEVKVK